MQEGLLRRELVPLYQALLADGSLKLDVVAYGDPEGAEAARQAFPESVRQYHRRFKLGGYKMFLDGPPQGTYRLAAGGPIRGSRNTGATAP